MADRQRELFAPVFGDVADAPPGAGLRWVGSWDRARGDKLGRRWSLWDGSRHTGFGFRHCGHPTALRPWSASWTAERFARTAHAQEGGLRAYQAGGETDGGEEPTLWGP